MSLRRCVLALALAASCRPPALPVARAPAQRRAPVDLRRNVDVRLLEQYTRTHRFSVGRPSRFTPTPDGSAVLFLRAPEGTSARALWQWERATGQSRVLATSEALLGNQRETNDPVELARRERQRISGSGITRYELSPDASRVLVPLSGKLFLVDRATGGASELPSAGGAPVDARFSPDGRYVALVRGGEVAVIDVATRIERRLTRGADDNTTHGVAEFIAQEELDRMEGWWWSPDSTRVVYQETDLSRVERLHIGDPSNPQDAPAVLPYPRAGSANATVRLAMVPAAGGLPTPIEWDHEAYPYLAAVRWTANAPLTLVLLNRLQNDLAIATVDADGHARVVHHERDEAWVNLPSELPRWSPDGRSFLWATERNGNWQIERRAADGALIAALTPPELNVRSFVNYDAARGALYALAGEDPTETHLVRVTDHDGAPRVEALTDTVGDHDAVVSDDGSLQVRTAHTLAALPRTTVHGRDGANLGAIDSFAEAPLELPRVELRTVGSEGFHVAIVRPRDFEPGRRYPVIAWVYGGPHSRLVTHMSERYIVQQWLADQGFVVVTADGRGTLGRGRAWERALWHRLGDVPLEDQASALQALGAADSSLDLRRVGVMGWSFGGYLSARAVIERPDVFHAAVAGAPVTDWREYDTCYTERYMGLPAEAPQAYEQQSLLPHAEGLRRPLLLVHGTADDNVYFHNGLRLADALFRAGRSFEFLPLAGQTHLVNEPRLVIAWLLRARAFLVESLRAR